MQSRTVRCTRVYPRYLTFLSVPILRPPVSDGRHRQDFKSFYTLGLFPLFCSFMLNWEVNIASRFIFFYPFFLWFDNYEDTGLCAYAIIKWSKESGFHGNRWFEAAENSNGLCLFMIIYGYCGIYHNLVSFNANLC